MKKLLFASALIALVTTTAVSFAESPIVLKYASTQPADFNLSPTYSAIYRFKDYVESATNGRVIVELNMNYPPSGDEKINFQVVQNGTFQLAHSPDGPLTGFFPAIQVLSIPYLFINEPIAWKVLDGKFGQEFGEEIKKTTGVRILAWAENGYRSFSNNVRPVKTPADMAGLKIRMMPNPAHLAMANALGAAAVPLSWGDLKKALPAGTVDGQENPLSLFVQNEFYKHQKYLTLDEHLYGLHFLWMNEAAFQNLPDDIKVIILDAAKVYRTVHRGQQQAIQARCIEAIKANGTMVYKPTDAEKAQFRAVSQGAVLKYLESQQIDKRWINLLLDEVKKAEADRLKEIKK